MTDEINGLTHYSSYSESGSKQIWDCVDPNYWRTKKRGGVFPYLPVTISDRLPEAEPEYHDLRRISDNKREHGYQYLTNPYIANLPELPTWDPAAIPFVVNAAVADAKAEALDALTTWAELPSTSRMLSKRFTDVLDFGSEAMARAISRSARRPWDIPKQFNQLWLEYRYGWRPLMADINNVVKQILDVQRSYNRGRQTLVIPVDGSNGLQIDGTARDIISTSVRSGSIILRGYAFAVGKFGTEPQFQPITTAWELIPYSFVVDWFIDIGSFIQAATPIPGVDIQGSGYSISYQYEETTSWWSATSGAPGWIVTSSTPGRYYRKISDYTRRPYPVSYPRLFPRLNTLRVVDLVSLTLQRAAPVLSRLNRR